MKRARASLKGGVVKLIASRDYRAWINDLRKRFEWTLTPADFSQRQTKLV